MCSNDYNTLHLIMPTLLPPSLAVLSRSGVYTHRLSIVLVGLNMSLPVVAIDDEINVLHST